VKAITYKGYAASVEFEPEDGVFVGRLLGINDVVSFHAESVRDLKAAFHEAVEDYIETCANVGKEAEKPYSGKVMFRVDPQVHAKAALAAQMSGKSLNQWAEEKLRSAAEAEAGQAVAF
jgi:predicted HicB family RNase H-like nuclease